MATTPNPYGLRPVRHLTGGEIRTQGFMNGIADGYMTTIYTGQPVKWSSGYLVPAAAGDTNIFGVFAGCQYDDTGRDHVVQFSPYYAASATSKNILAHVHTDPNIVFLILSDSVAITDRGKYADFVIGDPAGSTITGNASITLGTPGGSVANFFILDRFEIPASENPWGDDCQVEVVFAEHVFK